MPPTSVVVTHITEHEGDAWIELHPKDQKLIDTRYFSPPLRQHGTNKQAFVNKVWLHSMLFDEGRWDAINGFIFNKERT